MFFSKNMAQIKKNSKNLKILEYCTPQDHSHLPMDGAIAYFKTGSFGPKINRNFTELFFILEGALTIELEDQVFKLEKDDLFIIPTGKKHTLFGHNAKLFISCSPQFDPENMEFL